jgi:hypothetical protein
LILWSDVTPTLLGIETFKSKKWLIGLLETKPCSVKPFHFAEEGLTEEMIAILRQGDIILDCLPGSQAPRIAEFAKDYELHYANLTEYVAETEK